MLYAKLFLTIWIHDCPEIQSTAGLGNMSSLGMEIPPKKIISNIHVFFSKNLHLLNYNKSKTSIYRKHTNRKIRTFFQVGSAYTKNIYT